MKLLVDEKIKSHTLKKSIFAVTKSGTVSLEVCKLKNTFNHFIQDEYLKLFNSKNVSKSEIC